MKYFVFNAIFLSAIFSVSPALSQEYSYLPPSYSPSSSEPATKSPRLLLWYSPLMNSHTGADDLLTMHYGLSHLEDHFLPLRLWDEGDFLGKTGGMAYRFTKLLFIDDGLITFYTAVPQHEIFGHGYRVNEFNLSNVQYEFSPPWPYGDGTGLTSFYYSSPATITRDQDLAISMGGVEATGILAASIRSQWFQSQSMDYHQSLLYISSALELRSYLFLTNEASLNDPAEKSNDMLSYIELLNTKAGRTQRENFLLHLKDIEKQSRVGLIDPYLWYSFWVGLKTYLWSGQSTFEYPAISFRSFRYMPLMTYGLNPWGGEYRFENLFALEDHTVTCRLRLGDDTFQNSFGADLEIPRAISLLGFDLDVNFYYWNQPRLRLDIEDQKPITNQNGGGFSTNVQSPILDFPIPIRLALGGEYKTEGFLPGFNLAAGIGWRMGLALAL